MGCKGSKHSLLYGCGGGARAPESGHVARHSVALRSSTLGTLSLDRAVSFAAADGVTAAKSVKEESAGRPCRARATTRSVSNGWLFPSSPQMEPGTNRLRQIRQPPRMPTKTPARDPEEINVWELMDGLHDDDPEEEEECDGVEEEPSPAGSPEFDPDVLSAFRDALDELSPPSSPPPEATAAHAVKKNVFQQSVDGGGKLEEKRPSPPPPPESARRVVVYSTSLRGIRQTYEDCWAATTILSSYGVRVDERDLSMHAGFKDELRDALGVHGCRLPQVFVDGRHLGGAEEVRRMHESGELAEALEACDAAPGNGNGNGKEGGFAAAETCGGCGGARFVPCDVCSGSCKVFVVEDEDGAGAGAFRRCPECNENGLLRCHVCY